MIEDFQGLSLVVACGPFTPDNTNDYAPLDDLLELTLKSPPDVLILVSSHVRASNYSFYGNFFFPQICNGKNLKLFTLS